MLPPGELAQVVARVPCRPCPAGFRDICEEFHGRNMKKYGPREHSLASAAGAGKSTRVLGRLYARWPPRLQSDHFGVEEVLRRWPSPIPGYVGAGTVLSSVGGERARQAWVARSVTLTVPRPHERVPRDHPAPPASSPPLRPGSPGRPHHLGPRAGAPHASPSRPKPPFLRSNSAMPRSSSIRIALAIILAVTSLASSASAGGPQRRRSGRGPGQHREASSLTTATWN